MQASEISIDRHGDQHRFGGSRGLFLCYNRIFECTMIQDER